MYCYSSTVIDIPINNVQKSVSGQILASYLLAS